MELIVGILLIFVGCFLVRNLYQIYKYLKLKGLRNTSSWDSLTISERTKINNIINSFNNQGIENCQ